MENEQAVTEEANTGSETPVEENSAPDLDSLLKDFETEERPVQQEAPKVDDERLMRIEEFMRRQEMQEFNTALDEAAGGLKKASGEAVSGIPDRYFRGILRDEAVTNPNIEKAFNERHAKPEKWNDILTALGKKISNEFKTDKQATESWNAVEGAIHSASTSTEQDNMPDFNKMTDAEFTQWKLRHG